MMVNVDFVPDELDKAFYRQIGGHAESKNHSWESILSNIGVFFAKSLNDIESACNLWEVSLSYDPTCFNANYNLWLHRRDIKYLKSALESARNDPSRFKADISLKKQLFIEDLEREYETYLNKSL